MQQDEIVGAVTRIKPRDLSTASVILDFKTRAVIKSSVGDQVAPKDWQKIRDYYYQHYQDLIDDLERIYVEKSDNTG
jgi:hypothetical protein